MYSSNTCYILGKPQKNPILEILIIKRKNYFCLHWRMSQENEAKASKLLVGNAFTTAKWRLYHIISWDCRWQTHGKFQIRWQLIHRLIFLKAHLEPKKKKRSNLDNNRNLKILVKLIKLLLQVVYNLYIYEIFCTFIIQIFLWFSSLIFKK